MCSQLAPSSITGLCDRILLSAYQASLTEELNYSKKASLTHTRTHTHTHTHTHILREKDICVQLLNLRLRKLGKRIGGCDRRNQLWRRAPVVNTYTPTPTEPPTVKLAPNNPQPPASIPTHIHTWWHYWKGECVPLQHLVHKSSSRVFVERGQEQKV